MMMMMIYVLNRLISLVGRVFFNGPGDRFNPRSSHTKDFKKMGFDTSMLNIQHYKVRIKVKVVQSRDKSGALPYPTV